MDGRASGDDDDDVGSVVGLLAALERGDSDAEQARGEALLEMLAERIRLPDASHHAAADPLTPLAARLLLELTEHQPMRSHNGGAPILSRSALCELLASPAALDTRCAELRQSLLEQVARAVASPAAAALLDELIRRGTMLGVVRVRMQQAIGGLPVRCWPAPTRPLPPVLRLPGTTSAAELWERAVLPHVPCVVSGAFDGLVAHCTAESLAARYGHHRVRARRKFEAGDDGHRVFINRPGQEGTVEFGAWCADAAAGVPSARDCSPAKLPLRQTLHELSEYLEGEARPGTPLGRYGACVGAAAHAGIYMYAGAGANTTQTHFDPAENFLVIAQGSKTLQLLAPGEVANLDPSPNPLYHSTEVPAFSDPAGVPANKYRDYAAARTVEVTLEQGDMLYLPAYWYHGVKGGDGFNVLLAWWAAIHPRKRDGAETAEFDPVRPEYEGPFLKDGGNE